MAEPVYEQMYRFLLAEIDGGRLRPGERVPSEKELAAQFHASRITSKRALEMLAHEGIIERVRGRGSFVTAGALAGRPPHAGEPRTRAGGDPHMPRLVAFLVPDFSEPFGTRLVRALESRLRRHGLRLLLCRTEGNREQEEAAIDESLRLGACGLIVFPVYGEYYNERLLRLVLNRFPIALVDRYLRGIPVSSIYTDNRGAAEEVANHLLALGHRHIAFVTLPPSGTSSIEDRMQGMFAAMAEQGVPFVPEERIVYVYCTMPGAFTPDDQNVARDEETLRNYLRVHPEVTAFVACEYALAVLVERTVTQMGARVPEDFSIACFDAPYTLLDRRHMTHVLQDEEQMAEEAVSLLLQQLDGREAPLSVVSAHTLVVGESTAPVRREVRVLLPSEPA